MIIWSIQPLALYEKLMVLGVLHCDPDNESFCGLDSQGFRSAYDWLVEQMISRVGSPPKEVQYPFWAWALVDGVSKKPDLRGTKFNHNVGEYVVLELEISDADVLLSDEVNWHYVLNDWYLHNVNDDGDNWEETEMWFDNLPLDIKESVKRKSWERIFDKDDTDNDWAFVQATFWELKAEQVKKVQRFNGRVV